MESKEANRSLLYFNSSKGNVVSGSYFSTTISKPIDRIKQTEILSAVVPFTFYNINDGNALIGYYNDVGNDVPIYVSTNTLFTTTAALLSDFNNAFNHTTTLSIVSNKFVLSSQTARTVTVNPSLPGALMLGFNTTQTGLSVTAPVSTIANIPFYFHPANNLIQINLSGGTVGVSGGLSATIPTGYYDKTGYAAAVASTILNATNLSGVTVIAATTTYNSQTCGFDVSVTFDKTFTTGMIDLAYASYGELFTSTTGYTDTNSPASSILAISIPPPVGLVPKTLYVRSVAISNTMSVRPQYNIIHKIVIPSSSTKQAKYSGADVVPFQTVINGVPGKIIIDEAEYQIPLLAAKKQSLTTIDLQLLDENYSQVYLNGLSWSIAIIVTSV